VNLRSVKGESATSKHPILPAGLQKSIIWVDRPKVGHDFQQRNENRHDYHVFHSTLPDRLIGIDIPRLRAFQHSTPDHHFAKRDKECVFLDDNLKLNTISERFPVNPP
jgi:hypothetical protein